MRQQACLATGLTALGLFAACAGGGMGLREDPEVVRDRYSAYAGDPIDSFSWLGRFDSWESVGRHELVVFTGVSDAYLLTVAPPCDNLQFAQRIGLTSTGSTVYRRLDSVTSGGWRCPIEEIRKVDYKRMRADMRLDAERAKAATAAQAQR
jgi:Family of unknown function (DUF6491)